MVHFLPDKTAKRISDKKLILRLAAVLEGEAAMDAAIEANKRENQIKIREDKRVEVENWEKANRDETLREDSEHSDVFLSAEEGARSRTRVDR